MNRKPALIAALLVLVFVLSACGGGTATSPAQSSAAAATTAAAQTAAPAASTQAAPPDEEHPYRLTDEPITLTKWVSIDAVKIAPTTDNYATIACYQELEKLTNVKIEFIHPPIGQETEKFNLMLASGDYADIVDRGWAGVSGGPQKAIEDGVIVDLKDYIVPGTYLGDFFESRPEIRKMVVTDSGSMYVYPYLQIDQSVKTAYGYQYRGDWLEELGLDMPETMDEWYNMLLKLKEKGVNENGDKIYPLISRQIGSGISSIRTFANAYRTSYDWYLRDGKAQYGPLDPEFRDYLGTMVKWYSEGLIDEEFATYNDKEHDARVTSGVAGAWFSGLGSGMGLYINAFDRDDSKIVGGPYPVLNKGDKPMSVHIATGYGGSGCAIMTTCKYPDIAAKWLDFHYSEPGGMLLNWGVEGLNYNIVDGEPKFIDEIYNHPKGYSIDIAIGLYSMGSAVESYFQDSRVREVRMYNWESQRVASAHWNKADGSCVFPSVSYTDAEGAEHSSIMNEVNTYRDEMFMKFLMGLESMDNYDAFVQQLKNMKIERAVEIRQAALDRYNAR